MQQHERIHALDSVRGFALLTGVVLHATMSFLPGMTPIGWPIVDSSPSQTLAATFFWIHTFRMTTFFLIAGFFGHMLFHRGGARAFVRNRSTRILVPLVVGWIVLFPLLIASVAGGITLAGGTPPAPPSAVLPRPALAFPLMHLWFLYLLVLLYCVALLVRGLVRERFDRASSLGGAIDRLVHAAARGPWLIVLLGTPLAVALYLSPIWFKWFGIPTPDHSLIPNTPALIGFGTAFTFGWLLHRQTDVLKIWEQQWAVYLALAVGSTVTCLAMAGLSPEYAPATRSWSTLLYALTYAAGVWSWTIAIIGIGLRFFAKPGAIKRYIADASYWIYLVHLPLVMLLQALVHRLPWHWTVKFALVLSAALGVLFLSYHVFVRFTFVGEILNGRRQRRQPSGVPPVAPASNERRADDAGVPPSPGDAIATLKEARKSFGATLALDGLSLDVRRGELVAVLGPNGAGKSTAISLLLGLLRPDSGSVQVFGESPERIEARHQIGVMMQEVTLAPELRPRELIELTASYYPSPMTPDAAMALTQTASLAHRPYGKLSAGQKRQVQFALAVCGRPALLFLDEPTVGLEVQARETLWKTVRQLVADGCSIVLTTHYLEEAETLADRVIVLSKGRLIASGSVDDVRAIVARKRIRCFTSLTPGEISKWPAVTSATLESGRIDIVTTDAETIVRRLLDADERLRELEVQRAGLAEAFNELTQEAA